MEQRDSEVGVYAINAASEMTGIPVTTLRSWEKSFGVVRPARTDGGRRLHSQKENAEIKRCIAVVKTRTSDHDPVMRQFIITPEGTRVGDPFEWTSGN